MIESVPVNEERAHSFEASRRVPSRKDNPMVQHVRERTSSGPAANWCDECADPNPVWFRGVAGDVVSLCAACAPTPGAALRARLASNSSSGLRGRVKVGA